MVDKTIARHGKGSTFMVMVKSESASRCSGFDPPSVRYVPDSGRFILAAARELPGSTQSSNFSDTLATASLKQAPDSRHRGTECWFKTAFIDCAWASSEVLVRAMAQPVLWPARTFFYPIGNTPAAHLTASLAPETNADVLLLGCGDVRNILFTVYLESGNPRKRYDFTCNDHEPAVLTRNVLLLTMLLDESIDIPTIWNIYYHLRLDSASLNALNAQCQKILDLTDNLEEWNSHRFGSVLRFSSDSTLRAIRHHCNLYLEVATLSPRAKADLMASFKEGMAKTHRRVADANTSGGSFGAGSRSSGPLSHAAVSWFSRQCEFYWKHGVTAGMLSVGDEGHVHPNPTFAHSRAGRGFNVHAGSDPLVSFHLPFAFAPAEGSDLSRPVQSIEELSDTARAEFKKWCGAFRDLCREFPSVETPLRIRFILGDVISVCKALRSYQMDPEALDTSVYVAPWGGDKINLYASDYKVARTTNEGRAPQTFNVIETSNLSDHIGIINTLLSTIHLLRRSPDSLLSTHFLLKDIGRNNMNVLSDFGFDIPLLSLTFGVIPSRCLSNISSSSIATEAPGFDGRHQDLRQFHDQLQWRFLRPTEDYSPPTGDPSAFADVLFNVYHKLFEDERGEVLGTRSSLTSYDRTSFCELLSQVRRTFNFSPTEWGQLIGRLHDHIAQDRVAVLSLTNYQDLMLQLYTRKLNVTAALLRPVDVSHEPENSPLHPSLWKGGVVPSVVCVVLVVPRSRLKIIEDVDAAQVGVPNVECSTRGPTWHNIHSNIRPIFGTVIKRNDESMNTAQDGSPIEIVEDSSGWEGSSSLVVSFYMPTWILKHEKNPSKTLVALNFGAGSPWSTGVLTSLLGPFLEIYVTSFADREHVFVCRDRPDNSGELARIRAFADDQPRAPRHTWNSGVQLKTTLVFEKLGYKGRTGVSAIVLRAQLEGDYQKEVLANKQNSVERIEEAEGNFHVVVRYGPMRQPFPFPFPVDLAKLKIRVARKSLYIELEAPVQPDLEKLSDGLLNPFEVLNRRDGPPVCTSFPSVPLDTFPAVKCDPLPSVDWVKAISVEMFSEKEAAEKEKPKGGMRKNSLKDLKETILAMFDGAKRGKPFALGFHSGDGIVAIVFVNKLRFDLPNYSLVLDTCFMDLHRGLFESDDGMAVATVVDSLGRMGDNTVVNLSDREVILWKRMLPALVERCRTWSHKASCAYKRDADGGIPPSVGLAERALCDCGKGKDLGSFKDVPRWKPFEPYVVRAAISPLFPSNYDAIELFQVVRRNMPQTPYQGRQQVSNDAELAKLLRMAGLGSMPTAGSTEQRETPTTKEGACRKCKRGGKLLNCGRCKIAQYCSAVCQKEDWKTHKRECGK